MQAGGTGSSHNQSASSPGPQPTPAHRSSQVIQEVSELDQRIIWNYSEEHSEGSNSEHLSILNCQTCPNHSKSEQFQMASSLECFIYRQSPIFSLVTKNIF